ncbi:MAG: hypothetical protein ACXAC8_17690 [Candidatus Hodarchaeales archaeon]|jgi:hypothetical protein
MSSKKQQQIKSRISLFQQVSSDSELKNVLSHVAKDIGLHLDQMRKFWETAFFVKYKFTIDIEKTELWTDFRNLLVNKQLIRFVESQLQLFDLLALYAPEYYVKERHQDL